MAQRVVGTVGSSSVGEIDNKQKKPSRKYPEIHPLMPGSLNRIPTWYEASNFQYNSRLILGMLPSVILLFTVTGKIMAAAVLGGMLLILFIRYLKYNWVSMVLTVGHVVFLEVVNVYCMIPLIWRSVLNLPLYVIFHFFIAFSGIWWWLQEEEFCRQEPRFVILLERILFCFYPAVSVTMETWIFGILFGRSVLPFIILFVGVKAFSLYLMPLPSSFSKPNTSSADVLIQHRFVVWLYAVLVTTLPPLIYIAISYKNSLESNFLLSLLVVSPPFLLSLLEAQGIDQWFGLGPGMIQLIRMVLGLLVILLVSVSVSLAQPSSLLPLFLLPILFITMMLASFTDHTKSVSVPAVIMGGVLALFYSAAFVQLPWSIVHASSFLSLPLSVLQLLLWALALTVVAMMTLWKRVTPLMLAVYNGVFVLCEYILIWDKVYPLYISMATGAVALLTILRLHDVKKLPLSVCLFSMCLHVTKLSLLFPCTHSPYPLTASLLPLFSTFLTSFLLFRLFLFDHTPSLGSGRLLTYSGLLLVGLLLSVDTILSPVWASLTHTLPSSASLLATVLGAVALYVNYGLSLISEHDKALSSLPLNLGVMATLLWFLQPEFSIPELVGSVVVTFSDSYPEFIYLAAWKNFLTWLILFSTVFSLLQLANPHVPALTTISVSFLGVLAGFFSSISLLQSPPGTVSSLLYAGILGVGGALCGRAYSGQNTGSLTDRILFTILLLLCLLSYSIEWTTIPRLYIPGKPFLEYYSQPCCILTAVCSLLLAVVFRIKMYWMREEPYLPIIANISCLLFFGAAISQQFHYKLEITVLLSSLVFLLTQPDGYIRPKRSYVFLAPCLVASILVLYIISIGTSLPRLPLVFHNSSQITIAARIGELVCLVLAIPGQVLFLHSLWIDEGLSLSLHSMMMYILPSCFLPQLASTMASGILGSIGIFNFCLNVIGGFKLA